MSLKSLGEPFVRPFGRYPKNVYLVKNNAMKSVSPTTEICIFADYVVCFVC